MRRTSASHGRAAGWPPRNSRSSALSVLSRVVRSSANRPAVRCAYGGSLVVREPLGKYIVDGPLAAAQGIVHSSSRQIRGKGGADLLWLLRKRDQDLVDRELCVVTRPPCCDGVACVV